MKPPSSADVAALIEKIETSIGHLDIVQQTNLLPDFQPSKPKKFHVYALELSNGTVKIGIAQNVSKRANTVSHSSGLHIFDVYHTKPAVNARQVELACHKSFDNFRTKGEFFKISFKDACAEINKHLSEIDSANQIADEKYLQDVQTAWENYRKLETEYSLPKSDLVLVQNDQALTTSLIIAEKFNRLHKNVLQAIENELANLREIADESIERSFIKGEYKDAKGEMRPMYYLNRDAFFQVVLGFTGKAASKLRWNFIQEFNRMEAALKK